MRKYIKKLTSQGVKKIVCVILSIFLALTFCGCSFVGKHIVSCIGEMFEEALGFTYGDFGCCYHRNRKHISQKQELISGIREFSLGQSKASST